MFFELALHEEEQLVDRANWLDDTKPGAVLGFVIVSVAELLGFLLLVEARKLSDQNRLEIRPICTSETNKTVVIGF